MTIHTPPWCLQWSSDGELMGSDREDLWIGIAVEEQGLAQTLLTQLLGAEEPADRRSPGMPAQAAPMP